MGQSDGGSDQGSGARVVGHGEDEGLVELELVDGQLTQVAERAVAGAKVVDRDLDSAIAQPGQDVACPVAVGHQELLGDLQLQGAGWDASGSEHGEDLLRQAGVDQ